MRKKLSISQPAVIDTALPPLTYSFKLLTSATTEQWLYSNTNTYKPDRTITPLTITPSISAVDSVTNERIYPLIFNITWEHLPPVAAQIADAFHYEPIFIKITNTTDTGTEPLVILPSGALRVRQNNSSATYGWVIRCRVTYTDPRNAGVTFDVSDEVTLTTNIDANAVYPEIDILEPQTRTFNPINLTLSTYFRSFHATINWRNIIEVPEWRYVWYTIENGTEVLVQNSPFYANGQYTNTLVVNPSYSENIQIILRVEARNSPSESYELLPPRIQRSILWSVPPIDCIVVSENGGAVRSDKGTFTFSNIVNTNEGNLSEQIINDNLRFKWKRRREGSSSETNLGWGPTMDVKASDLILPSSKAIVSNEVYILGAYERVTYNGEELTYNSMELYARTVN